MYKFLKLWNESLKASSLRSVRLKINTFRPQKKVYFTTIYLQLKQLYSNHPRRTNSSFLTPTIREIQDKGRAEATTILKLQFLNCLRFLYPSRKLLLKSHYQTNSRIRECLCAISMFSLD